MPYSIVIPARYAATRLPGKPLREIAGKPLLQYVYECAKRTQARQVIVATDDTRIQQAALAFGADVCMTSDQHQSGTQRINEVIQQRDFPDDEIQVQVNENVRGCNIYILQPTNPPVATHLLVLLLIVDAADGRGPPV